MARKFEEVFEVLDYNELMRFKDDFDHGSIAIKKLLEVKVKERLKEHERICATCSNNLNFYKSNNYTLIFGPDDFKKKASFCGLDCLEYFISKMKNSAKRNEKVDNQYI